MTPVSPGRSYYPALDGLRGLAILLVIIYHNFGFINYFFFGWLGVDLFFVLSGFLITDILLRDTGKKNYLFNFYMRRILRIFPLYYLFLLIFLIVIPLFNHLPVNLDYYIHHQWWLWVYLQNWLFIFWPSAGTDVLHHLWSLAVEEQFYAVWPCVILLIKKPRYLLILMTAVLGAVIIFRFIIWNYHIERLEYFNLYTFSRIDGIAIGSILALLQNIKFNFLKKNTTAIVLVLAAANFIFYFFNSSYQFSFPYLAIVGYTTFAIMFALLINEAVTRETTLINILFDNRVMRFFGKISYGLYLFHWPVYLYLGPSLKEYAMTHFTEHYASLITSIIATMAAIVISITSYVTFERYFLRLKKNFNFNQ